jgi:peptidyl-prolyl cis-trans isomerase D
MLQNIRDYFSGIFSWIIILMIGVPFALWGINSYTDKEGKASDVALVNGVGISQPEFLKASQQQQARMKEMLGQAYNPEMFNTPQYKRQILDQLIERSLLEQAASNAGLDISDAVLGATIKNAPDLQRNGAYAPDMYEKFLRNQGLTAAGFEARLRNSQRVEQLHNAVAGTAILTAHDLDELINLREQRRDIAYLLLSQAGYLDGVKVDEAKVSAYYDSHHDSYMNPEQVQVDYVDYSTDALAAAVPVTEQVLHHYYDEQAANQSTEEQRSASHILIQVAAAADAKALDAAHATLAKIQARLKTGDAFDALAKQYSQDKASAVKGGDLGFFGKGVMDKSFEDAVFKLDKNAVSEPVRSSFGFHLIKLTDIKPAHRKSFEEARADLEHAYRRSQAEKQYYDHTDGLADTAYQQPDSLDPAAKLLQTTIHTSDWLTRKGGPGIGAFPKVIEAAFSSEVLTQNNNSEPIEVAPGHVIVLRSKVHHPASVKPLAEVHDLIVKALQEEAARAKTAEAGKAMLQRLNKGETLAVLATQAKLTVKEVQGLRRNDPGQPAPIVKAAFRLARPDKTQARYDAVALDNGDYAVLMLQAVHEGDPAKLSKEDRLAYQRELQRAYSEAEVQALIDHLRAQAKIKVWDERLN